MTQSAENDATLLALALDPYAFADHWNDRPYVARRRAAKAEAKRFLDTARSAGWRVLPPVDPDALCLTCGATNGVCRCPIPPGQNT